MSKNQTHDLFFKSFMQEKPLAIAFLKLYCPEFIQEFMDFSTLTLVNPEPLPAPLKKLQCDVIFHCTLKRGAGSLYLIIEHQSTAHRLMPLRVHEYTTALMRYHLKQGNRTLPLVLPIVIYHGRRSPYPVSAELWDLFDNRQCAEQLMFKAHQLIDISEMTDEVIASHGAVSLLEWPLRDAYQKGEHFLDKTKQQLKRLSYHEALEQHPDFKLALFRYTIGTYRGSKSPVEVISELIQAVPEEKGFMLTAGQQLEQRGRQQGLQQGVQQGLHQGVQQGVEQEKREIAKRLLDRGMALEDITQITGLAQKELSRLH
jgi:predicted transposase/invertase (TIGR01784 family)